MEIRDVFVDVLARFSFLTEVRSEWQLNCWDEAMPHFSLREFFRRARRKRLLIGSSLLLLPILVGILGYFLVRPGPVSVPRSPESRCRSNMGNLGLALRNYAATHNGMFPPAYASDSDGNRLYSWRVLLTPFLDYEAFYEAYDLNRPWYRPENLKLTDQIRCFTCPASLKSEGLRRSGFASTHATNYVGVVGPATAFPGSERVSMDLIHSRDGLENTILLVEIVGSDIHWSEPRDLEFDQMSFRINDPSKPSISSPHADGPGVVFADGRYKRLSESIPPDVVKALLTIDGGEKISRRELESQGFLK